MCNIPQTTTCELFRGIKDVIVLFLRVNSQFSFIGADEKMTGARWSAAGAVAVNRLCLRATFFNLGSISMGLITCVRRVIVVSASSRPP